MQLASSHIGGAAQVEQGLDAGGAEGDVEQPLAPGAPEGVGDEHATFAPVASAQAIAQAPRRGIWILGQQDDAVGREAVRLVDAGVGAHPAGAGLDDQVPLSILTMRFVSRSTTSTMRGSLPRPAPRW